MSLLPSARADAPAPTRPPRLPAAGRRRLLAFVTVLLLGGLTTGVNLRGWARSADDPSAARDATPAATTANSDRWGELKVTPIVISPPAEYIPIEAYEPVQPRWHFPKTTMDGLARVLESVGLGADDVARLTATAQAAPAIEGVVVSPPTDLIRGMTPDVRGRLYLLLGRSPLNFAQQSAFRFYGQSLDEWLGPDLSPKTRALIEPLVYRSGDFMFFADLELIRGQIGGGPELQHLVKRLLSQATALVTLRINDPTKLDELVEYWGRGGRKTDIRPLLESIVDGGPGYAIDITHLLPEMARRLLYRYPKVSLEDLSKPQLANCFWTALNFFNDEPDDSLLDPARALQRLKQGYFIVHDDLQLGDIVAFSDRNLNVFHVAVYIADDLVFTKNGFFSLAPWTIIPMERLKGHFAEHLDDWNVSYYRRKDL
ncbi:MAG: hypothetical protein R2752_05745 [Vicinamibacterales bacterium]